MNLTTRKNSIIVLFAFVLLMTSCQKDKWEQTASTKITIQESEDEDLKINNGKAELEKAQLHISQMTLTGKRLQSDDPNVTIDQQRMFDFKEGTISSKLSIEIPQGNYDELHLTLISDSTNNFTIELDYEHPGQGQGQGQNNDYTIVMSFNIDDIAPIQIKSKDQESSFLIDAENNYQISINLDLETLFKGVPPGIWNAMINSNNNQQNIVEINNNFNYLVKEKIEKNIHESIVIELK